MTALLSAQHTLKVVDKKNRPLEMRLLHEGDEEKLLAFFESFSKESRAHFQPHPFTKSFISKMIKDRSADSHIRAVVLDPKNHYIVGYAFLTQPPVFSENSYFGIAVADDYQGRGISMVLMTQLFAYAQQQGVKMVYLNVFADNKVAVGAYIKQGFKEIPSPLFLSKVFTLYELWYNDTLHELFQSKPKTSEPKPVIWMVKDLI